MMTLETLRTVIMLVSLSAFLGVVLWAFYPRGKHRFDDAANLPFADDDMQQRTISKTKLPHNRNSNHG